MEIVDKDYGNRFIGAASKPVRILRIISPFVKIGAIRRLVAELKADRVELVTRYDLNDFFSGVSDIAGLEFVLDHGGDIRGISKLHAKLYLADDQVSFATSSNLTKAGLFGGNQEFGVLLDNQEDILASQMYFSKLWKIGAQCTYEDLSKWKEKLKTAKKGQLGKKSPKLLDHGADFGYSPEINSNKAFIGPTETAYIKFLGRSPDRVSLMHTVLDEIERSGCHWALGYPANKRPIGVEEGSTFFIARLTTEGIMIFGRAVGHAFDANRDVASQEDIRHHPWKSSWPNYVRVSRAEFIDGNVGDGISFEELVSMFGHETLASTQRNYLSGSGNLNPRKSIMQKAAIEITPNASAWLNDKLDEKMLRNGVLSPKSYASFYKSNITVHTA